VSNDYIKIFKSWILSPEGVFILGLCFFASCLWFTGNKDLAFIVTVLDIVVSIFDIAYSKFQQISIIKEKVRNYEVIIDKIITSPYTLLLGLEQVKTPQELEFWKNSMIDHAFQKFSANPSLLPKDLLEETIINWFDFYLKNWKDEAYKDFLIYTFIKEVFPEELEIIAKIEKKYSDFEHIFLDDRKRPFLGLIYYYFLANKKDWKSLKNYGYNLNDRDKLREAFYFIKDFREQATQIVGRIEQALTEKDKAAYLLKLTDELRQHFQERGISLEKYGEVFLSELKNAYIIFTMEKKGYSEIKNAIKASKIPRTDLYFTGPHLLYPHPSINTATKLKKLLFPKLSKEYPHVVFIIRALPSDISISSGKTTPQLKRTKRKLEFIGTLANRTKIYLTALDKLPVDFFESISVDFLVLSLRGKDKNIFRTKEKQLREKIKEKLGIEIKKLTDYSLLKPNDEEQLIKILIELGFGKTISKVYANEIINQSKKWRYILYGSPVPEELIK